MDEDGSRHLCGYLALARQLAINTTPLTRPRRLHTIVNGVVSSELRALQTLLVQAHNKYRREITRVIAGPERAMTDSQAQAYLIQRTRRIASIDTSESNTGKIAQDQELGGESYCDFVALTLETRTPVYFLQEGSKMLTVIQATNNNVTITEARIDQVVVPPTAFVIESVSDNYHYQSYPPSTDEPPQRAIAGTLLDSRPLAPPARTDAPAIVVGGNNTNPPKRQRTKPRKSPQVPTPSPSSIDGHRKRIVARTNLEKALAPLGDPEALHGHYPGLCVNCGQGLKPFSKFSRVLAGNKTDLACQMITDGVLSRCL